MSNPLDISRWLQQPRKHYTGARMQQGRVLLDSDFNEEAQLVDEDRKRALIDVIGVAGSPDQGFSLDVTPNKQVYFTNVQLGNGASTYVLDLTIRPGTFYLGGMRFELEQAEKLYFQRDYLQLSQGAAGNNGNLVTFLHAWEQTVSAVEDDELREKALGGPDTSGRVRRMRRVEWRESNEAVDCDSGWEVVRSELESTLNSTYDGKTGELKSNARLSVEFVQGPTNDACGPCNPSAEGRYLGAENQAIRLMLTGPDRYVWAYDNSAPLYRVTLNQGVVTMLTPPKDEVHYPVANAVVELLPWSAILDNGQRVAEEVGTFVRCTGRYDAGSRSFTIDDSTLSDDSLITHWDAKHPEAATLNSQDQNEQYVYMRVWHVLDADATELDIAGNAGLPLGTTGIVPTLRANGRRGDTWIISARPETPEELLPWDIKDNPNGVPPHGPHHYYVSLGVIEWGQGGGDGGRVPGVIHDCRPRFQPLTEQTHCCTYRVGDGELSHGDFKTIQAAVDALPASGGKVCVLPGVYRDPVRIDGRVNVMIEGCGMRTRLESPLPDSEDAPAELAALIQITDSAYVWIKDMVLAPQGHTAILAGTRDNDGRGSVRNLTLEKLFVLARIDEENENEAKCGLELREVVLARIDDCDVLMDGTSVSDDPAIFVQGLGIEVEHNRVATLACVEEIYETIADRPVYKDPGPILIFHPEQGEVLKAKLGEKQVAAQAKAASEGGAVKIGIGTGLDIGNRISLPPRRIPMRAWGGIQIGGPSVDVIVRDNVIEGGLGHGITLGSVKWVADDDSFPIYWFGPGFGIISRGDCDDWPGWPDPTPLPQNPDGPNYHPVISGDLFRVQILNNQISQMTGSGISVLATLVPVPQVFRKQLALSFNSSFDLFGLADSMIAENQIRNNVLGTAFRPRLKRVLDDIPDELDRVGQIVLPDFVFGGVVLGEVERTTIRDNVIVGNGGSDRVPVCGIVALLAEELSIEQNRITENGTTFVNDDSVGYGFGPRGGIVIGLASAPSDTDTNVPTRTALRVRENIVDQPVGRALQVNAVGNVAVSGNEFTSHPNLATEPSMLGATVQILDASVSADSFYQRYFAAKVEKDTSEVNASVGNVKTSFFAAAPGIIAPPKYDFGSIWFSGGIAFNDNRVFLRTSDELTPSPAPTQAFLWTFDSLVCQGNQFSTNIWGLGLSTNEDGGISNRIIRFRPQLVTDVFGLGYTAQLHANRMSEFPYDVAASLISAGLRNATVGNVASNCILFLGPESGNVANFSGGYGCEDKADAATSSINRGYLAVLKVLLGVDPGDDGEDSEDESPIDELQHSLLQQVRALVYSLRASLSWKSRILSRRYQVYRLLNTGKLSAGLCTHPIVLDPGPSIDKEIARLDRRQIALTKLTDVVSASFRGTAQQASASAANTSTDSSASAASQVSADEPGDEGLHMNVPTKPSAGSVDGTPIIAKPGAPVEVASMAKPEVAEAVDVSKVSEAPPPAADRELKLHKLKKKSEAPGKKPPKKT